MIIDQAGRLDVLINNAGFIGPAAASEELSLEQLKALFETNFFGVVQMTNAVLPLFRRQGSGQIINVSSAAGLLTTPPFFGAYAASKKGLAARGSVPFKVYYMCDQGLEARFDPASANRFRGISICWVVLKASS